MRPPNNSGRRPRGRHTRRSNTNQQPVRNTVYDSNGPEVRVRGNASQISEKYLSLARDAASVGDTVKMEACYQFAEHYQRILNGLKEREAAARPPAREPRDPQSPRDRNSRDKPNDRNNQRTGDRNQDRNQDRSESRGQTTANTSQVSDNRANHSQDAGSNVEDDKAIEIKAEVVTNGSIDLSEAEQPNVDMDVESITASITPEATPRQEKTSDAKPAVKRKPRAPRAPRAARAPRASDLKKSAVDQPAEAKSETKATPENNTAEKSKAFENTPLPGFLSPDGK